MTPNTIPDTRPTVADLVRLRDDPSADPDQQLEAACELIDRAFAAVAPDVTQTPQQH